MVQMNPHSPLDIAREADGMGRQNDSRAFQNIMLVSLGATAAARMGH